MTIQLETLDIYPTPHPLPTVQRAGFALDHPYIEQVWGPVIGPSSVALLRHCVWRWQDGVPARVDGAELAAEIGLGRSQSLLWRTMGRLDRFRLARLDPAGAELQVFTQVAPVSERHFERLPQWSRARHERLLGQHLDALAAPTAEEPPAHVRATAHLDRIAAAAANAGCTSRALGR